jgi:glycosyltransferase involved in cell wall biosynthesis
MLKLSLIIPTFNEERHIKACLEAVAKQTVKPYEVIVVNNNSTDRTLEIAEKYEFVSIVHEKKQGRGHARTRGFNEANGDILGRIDADSRIHETWVERVIERFEDDNDLAGLTGMAYVPFIPYMSSPKSQLFARTYYWFAHASFDTITTWGANMAISKKAWQEVKDKVCLDDSIVHEDQDVSLWIAANGGKILQDNLLLMTTDAQSYRYLPKFLHYYKMYKSTKKYHKELGNFDSKEMRHLGFFNTLPGRLMAILPSVAIALASIILFPLDYVLLRSKRKPKSLIDLTK